MAKTGKTNVGDKKANAGREGKNGATSNGDPTSNGSETWGLLVGAFPQSKREVHNVKPQTSIREAVTVMLTNKISHLPVMQSARTVKGLLRWKDVGKHFALSNGTADDSVERAMCQAEIVSSTVSLLETVPRIMEHGCVLVRDEKNVISGIVTKKDLARFLENMAHRFFLVGGIESALRSIIERGDFTSAELRELALDPASIGRSVKSVSDLSFGEYERLLQRDECWDRVKVPLERAVFIAHLREVRDIRNKVMHFSSDDDSAQHRRTLKTFWELLCYLNRI